MATRRRKKPKSLAVKSAELAMAVPQVIAHRVTQLALSGPALVDRDRKEFHLMVNEKHAAFVQAWSGMAMEAARANCAITGAIFRSLFNPFSTKNPSAASIAAQAQDAAVVVLDKGLAPVHRAAISNAKRLNKTRISR